ncbi:condensation domain-containing protein [Actinomadura fibrosa]|uniref:Condensation domain-containing protein n=1 Tax=Actinomadura fibrosa TaxID=111802 RepID=A0ABW2Y0X6_9ACTN|nr:condensation domain-containing protein [Actinomadura fibrosa]
MGDGPLPAELAPSGIPLSSQQRFFCSLDRGDAGGAFGAKHVASVGWRLRGRVDPAALRAALDDVVARHEALRTTIARDGAVRYQTVHPAGPVRLTVRDLPDGAAGQRDLRAEEFLNEIESLDYPVGELPHLRAALGRFDGEDAVLVLIVHHVAADGWSMRLVMRDLVACYAVRRGRGGPGPGAVRQYRDYAALPPEAAAGSDFARACGYWRETLRGARMTTIATDRPAGGEPAVYACHRFLLDTALTGGALETARALRGTPFMVFMAAHMLLLRELTGRDDVVAGTFSAGRAQESFHDTVGVFLNFLPLRTDLSDCGTFREAVERVRTTCLEAYTHDIPFGHVEAEAPGLMDTAAAPDQELIAFEVLQFPPVPASVPVAGLRFEEIRRRVLSQAVSCDIPDGGLWALDVLPSGETACSLKFNARVFDADTMWTMAREFERILRGGLTAPEDPRWSGSRA